MPVLPIYGGPSKRALVQMAYEELGRADYNYQIEPEEYDSALRRLDSLMAEWRAQGIILNYNFPASVQSSPDDESGIPYDAQQVVAGYLALRLAPTIGKTLPAEVVTVLARSLDLLRGQYASIPTVDYGASTPIGAGNRWPQRWSPYFLPDQTPVTPIGFLE